MSTPDAGAAARAATMAMEQQKMSMKALASAPVTKKFDSSKVTEKLMTDEIIVVLETKMDKKGKTFVHHAKGWTPLQDLSTGRALLTPVEVPLNQKSTMSVGSRMMVKVQAPYFQKHEKDQTVLGVLRPGSIIEVLETKMDSSGRPKIRHSGGWTPLAAPNGGTVLEVISSPRPSPMPTQASIPESLPVPAPTPAPVPPPAAAPTPAPTPNAKSEDPWAGMLDVDMSPATPPKKETFLPEEEVQAPPSKPPARSMQRRHSIASGHMSRMQDAADAADAFSGITPTGATPETGGIR
jgi:hypothetical protein